MRLSATRRCDGDQAAVALGEAGSLPDIAEQHVVGQLDELWREVADHLLCWAGSVSHAPTVRRSSCPWESLPVPLVARSPTGRRAVVG